MSSEKRIQWLDMARGIAMVLVVLTHIDFTPAVNKSFITCFSLPLFFFISGYFNPKKIKGFKELIVSRLKSIIIPMYIIIIINLIMSSIFSFHEQKSGMLEAIIYSFIQIRGKGDAMWFIACLFVVEVIFWGIRKISKDNEKIILLLIVSSAIIGVVWVKMIHVALPWHIDTACITTLFFGSGYLYKLNEERFQFLKNNVVVIAIIMLYCIIKYIDGYILMHGLDIHMQIGSGYLSYFIVSILGILMSVAVIQKIPKSNLLIYIGQNTLLYYGFHGKIMRLFIVITTKLVEKFSINMTVINQYMMCLFVLITTCITMLIPCYIVNRYFPFIIGKKQVKSGK